MDNKKNNQENDKHLADEQIIDMYWQREEDAITQTDRKYGKYLLSVAYNILRDPLDSEECQNDTYLDVWNTVPPAWPSVFLSFLTKIMRHRAIDSYREKNSKKRIPSELTASLDELGDMLIDDFSEEEYDSALLGNVISSWLRTLSDREQLIFVYRYYYADRVSFIARMLDISERTVYTDLASIKEGLKERLIKEGYSI